MRNDRFVRHAKPSSLRNRRRFVVLYVFCLYFTVVIKRIEQLDLSYILVKFMSDKGDAIALSSQKQVV